METTYGVLMVFQEVFTCQHTVLTAKRLNAAVLRIAKRRHIFACGSFLAPTSLLFPFMEF